MGQTDSPGQTHAHEQVPYRFDLRGQEPLYLWRRTDVRKWCHTWRGGRYLRQRHRITDPTATTILRLPPTRAQVTAALQRSADLLPTPLRAGLLAAVLAEQHCSAKCIRANLVRRLRLAPSRRELNVWSGQAIAALEDYLRREFDSVPWYQVRWIRVR